MQAGDPSSDLTELEGAILSEIAHRGTQTAFKVRRSFARSPSLEWRGSAGSVYAAVRRLEVRGMIAAAETEDGRAARLLSITPRGEQAMLDWACDARRATSVGIDPFRMRSGIWNGLGPAKRAENLAAIAEELERSIAMLETFSLNDDAIERNSVDLALVLQRARLGWLKRQQ